MSLHAGCYWGVLGAVLSTIVVDHQLTEPAPTAVGCHTALPFEDFYTANESRLFRALFVLTGDRHQAEDLMQTAFCKVWERWDRVSDLDDPVGYLFRTAFNTHHSATRRAMRAARRLVDRSSDRPAPLEPAELAAVRDRATRALDVLTPRQREAVVLTALLGFGRADAAQVMGIRPATVRVLVSQARAALAAAPEDEA
jgi:RNA polymerase sigma-70 factor (ECF subfamily)